MVRGSCQEKNGGKLGRTQVDLCFLWWSCPRAPKTTVTESVQKRCRHETKIFFELLHPHRQGIESHHVRTAWYPSPPKTNRLINPQNKSSIQPLPWRFDAKIGVYNPFEKKRVSHPIRLQLGKNIFSLYFLQSRWKFSFFEQRLRN